MRQVGIGLILLGLMSGLVGCQTDPSTVVSMPEPIPVVISFADYESNRQAYEPLMTQFHELHPAIEVQFVPLEDILSGEGYDLQQVASAAETAVLRSPPQGVEVTYFRDLVPFIEADPTFDTADFWPGLLAGCQQGGHMFGLPVAVDLNFVFFNGTAFDAASLPRPAPGWTWDDFQEAVHELTQWEDNQVTRYGFVPWGNPTTLLGPIVDAVLADTDDKLDPVALAAALDWYVTLVVQGSIPAAGENEEAWEQHETLIGSGQAAMWVDTLLNLPWRRSSLNSEIAVVPFPVSTDGLMLHTTPAMPSCVVMSTGTSHLQEAWAWLNFLTTHLVYEGPGHVPARPSVAESRGYWDDVTAETQQALRFALEHAWYGHDSGTLQIVDEALALTLAGESDLASALALADKVPLAQATVPASSVPIVVATPQPSAVPRDAVLVDYFVNTLVHPGRAPIATLAEEFNRIHPGIEVRPSTDLPGPAFHSLTIVDLAKRFDCFAWPSNAPAQLLGHFYSLDPLLVAGDASLVDDFYPALLDTFRADGDLYALPAASQPTVIYYNVNHLAKMNLEPPALDWTVDDWIALATAATSGEGSDKTYGFVPFQGDVTSLLLAAQGVRLYDLDTESPTVHLDDPGVVNAVAWMVSLANAGIMPPWDDGGTRSLLGNRVLREELIVSGHAALWTDLAWWLPGGSVMGKELDFQIGMAPLPLVRDLPLEPPLAHGLYISHQAEDPHACWLWLTFLSEQPDIFWGMPARRSVAESEAWELAVGANVAAAYRASLSRAVRDHPNGDTARYPSWPIDAWWQDALAAAFAGQDPAVALAVAQHKANAYLSCMALAPGNNGGQSSACAREADPDFKTFEELLREESP